MSIFARIYARIFAWLNTGIEHDPVLSHVPVASPKSLNARRFKRLRDKAEKLHGKQFRVDAKVSRAEPPSDLLNKLKAASKPAVTKNVSTLKVGKR